MSLFDDDSDSMSTSSSDSLGGEATTNTSSTSQPPSIANAMAVLDQRKRFTLTAADVQRSQEERRKKTIEQMNCHRGGAVWSSSSGSAAVRGGGGSVFGDSIAAALQLRKEDKEQLLLRRIKAERASEANDAGLVEKDLEVGVFVTPQYKELLRRHIKRREDADPIADPDSTVTVEREDTADVLEAYLRKVESEAAAVVGDSATVSVVPSVGDAHFAGDYYDRIMSAAIETGSVVVNREAERGSTDTEASIAHADGISSAPAPDLAELQRLVGAAPSAEDVEATQGPSTRFVNGETSNSAAAATAKRQSAAEEHKRSLYEAREARKRARADEVAINVCASRCEARIMQCVRII